MPGYLFVEFTPPAQIALRLRGSLAAAGRGDGPLAATVAWGGVTHSCPQALHSLDAVSVPNRTRALRLPRDSLPSSCACSCSCAGAARSTAPYRGRAEALQCAGKGAGLFSTNRSQSIVSAVPARTQRCLAGKSESRARCRMSLTRTHRVRPAVVSTFAHILHLGPRQTA